MGMPVNNLREKEGVVAQRGKGMIINKNRMTRNELLLREKNVPVKKGGDGPRGGGRKILSTCLNL